MDLMKLFVTIGAKGVKETEGEIDSVTAHGEKAGSKLGKVLGGVGNFALGLGKAAAVGLAAGSAAIIGLGKSAVTAYGEYEQLVGGVETLFGTGGRSVEEYASFVGKSVDEIQGKYADLETAQSTVLSNAANAYKTAGLSANEYMNMVTGFSASLIASLEGDTVKAANVADMAITDMSDNANKMGTSMESIQTAYQGFAKQNYTMLDNLKLGYGGTKSEMERLLADASQLPAAMGKKFDISNFADISEAIHLLQVEMGISGITFKEYQELVESGAMSEAEAYKLLGTTAKEANFTLQGSLNQMKGAWQNLLTGLADEKQDPSLLITNLSESITIFADNLVPRINQVLSTLPELITNLVPQLLNKIQEIAGELIPGIVSGATQLINALVGAFPQIIDAIIQIAPQLIDGVMQIVNALVAALPQIIATLIQGLSQALPQLIAMLPTIIDTVITTLLDNLSLIIEAGFQLLIALITGLVEAIPQLIEYIPTIIDAIITTLLDNLPLIIECAIQLIVALINGLIQALPQLIEMAPKIIITLVQTLVDNLPKLLEAGKTLLIAVINGIGSILSKLGEVGKNIVTGLWNGISGAKDWLLGKIKSWCGSVLNGIKSFFGIKSPSIVMRDEVGKMIAQGVAVGISEAKDYVIYAIDELGEDARTEVEKVMDSFNAEMLDSEKLYISESERLEKEHEKVKEQISEEQNSDLKKSLQKKFEAQEKADKVYLEGLKNTAEKERKIYDAKQKDIENYRKKVIGVYKELAEEIYDKISDVQSAEQSMSRKLKDFGALTGTVTVTDADGSTTSYNRLLDLSEQTEKLREYSDLLQSVKARGGVPREFFSIMRDMSVEEGISFAQTLMNASDSDFDKYISDWTEKQETATLISKELYAEETAEIANSIDTEFQKIADKMFPEGENAAEKWGEGFMEKITSMIDTFYSGFTNSLLGIAPFAVASSPVITNNITQNITSTEHTAYETSKLLRKELNAFNERLVLG